MREVAAGILYYGAVRFGLRLAPENTIVSPVWPPSGIALAAVLLLGPRAGPALLLGAFLAGVGELLAGGRPPGVSLAAAGGIAAGNTAEALLGAFLLRRSAGFPHCLDLPQQVFKFAALAGALSCVVAATGGVACLCLSGLADPGEAGALWWTWWLCDATGILLVTPFLLAWGRRPRIPAERRQMAEVALLLAATLLVSLLVFGIWPSPARARYPHPLLYLTLPFPIWAALRFGQRGATTALLLVSSVALWGATHVAQPFAWGSAGESLLSLQTFLGLMAMTVLVLSAARRGEEALRASEARYRRVAEGKRAQEETQRRSRELAALGFLIAAAGGSPETSEVLAALKQQLAERLGFPGGAIFLREEPGDDLGLRESWGLPDDVLSSIHHLPEPLFASCSVWETNTCVTIPLLAGVQGTVHGVVFLFSPAPPRLLEEDLFFFETLGRQVGGTLGSVRQIRSLSRRLVAVREEERALIARELHDQIGQMLTGLTLTLEMSQRVPPEAAGARLTAARELAGDLIARVRAMSLDLRPSMLDDFGLLSALGWHCKRYTAQTGVRVAFEHQDLEGRRFPSLVETAAYRSVQEALTNVARHAGVPEARVRLWIEGARLWVQIADTGAGFDVDAVRAAGNTSGLAGMRERARLLGGRLHIVSSPGQGTTVTAEFPVNAAGEEKNKRT